MFFFPQDVLKRNQAKKMFESHRGRKEGMNFLGWRAGADRTGVCSDSKALEKMPCIDAGICQNGRRMWKRDFRLTAGSMLYAETFEQSNEYDLCGFLFQPYN